MKIGQSIEFLRDQEPPLKSTNTRVIAAALSCGCKPAEKAYSDTVEDTPEGPKRVVTWIMDGDEKAVFEPIEKREELSFSEVRARFTDRQWCIANPNHPIAYIRAYYDNLNSLLDFVRQQKPMVLIRRGNKTAVIPADCSDERRQKILSQL
jgi:hypothetical protein